MVRKMCSGLLVVDVEVVAVKVDLARAPPRGMKEMAL